MAIMDKYLEFCDTVSLSTGLIAAATTVLGDVIELAKAKNPSSGKGSTVFAHIKFVAAATSGGSATVAFNLQHAGTNTPTSFSNIGGLMPATAVALCVIGYEANVALPAVTMKRFIRIVQAIGTTKLTAGSIDAWLDLADDC